jgi:class 3 adenylate cyclase
LKIRYAVEYILNPAQQKQYSKTYVPLKYVVGIDTSPLFVARTGVRGANDLVWVGKAANYAAKLTSLPDSYSSYITADVYDVLNASVKASEGQRSIWEAVRWDTFDNSVIYRSNWWWRFS